MKACAHCPGLLLCSRVRLAVGCSRETTPALFPTHPPAADAAGAAVVVVTAGSPGFLRVQRCGHARRHGHDDGALRHYANGSSQECASSVHLALRATIHRDPGRTCAFGTRVTVRGPLAVAAVTGRIAHRARNACACCALASARHSTQVPSPGVADLEIVCSERFGRSRVAIAPDLVHANGDHHAFPDCCAAPTRAAVAAMAVRGAAAGGGVACQRRACRRSRQTDRHAGPKPARPEWRDRRA